MEEQNKEKLEDVIKKKKGPAEHKDGVLELYIVENPLCYLSSRHEELLDKGANVDRLTSRRREARYQTKVVSELKRYWEFELQREGPRVTG